jgi:hypothetical protein
MTKREAYAAVVVALRRFRNQPTTKAHQTLTRAVKALEAFTRGDTSD